MIQENDPRPEPDTRRREVRHVRLRCARSLHRLQGPALAHRQVNRGRAAMMHSVVRLNWHRDLILAHPRQRGVARRLFRAVFR
jgi:hypothetical protein